MIDLAHLYRFEGSYPSVYKWLAKPPSHTVQPGLGQREARWKRTLPARRGGLAQLGERLPCKQEVSGSNPLISTMYVGR